MGSEHPWLWLGQRVSGSPGLGSFPGCFILAHWHSFPQVWWGQGEVMAAAWQEGGEQGEWFGLLHSPSTSGAAPKCRSAGLGLCTVGCSLFVNQALHQSLRELWFGEDSQAVLAWLFSFFPPCSIVHLNTSAPVPVPAVTIVVLEHESPFSPTALNVRLLNNEV